MSIELLPVAPFLAIVEEAVVREGSLEAVVRLIVDAPALDHRRMKSQTMYRRVSWWRTHARHGSSGGEYGSGFVSLEVADRIVTRLLGADAWHTRPELAALYEPDAA